MVMFLQKGKEGEQYKSQGALAVGSRRYTGELMPSTLCHGGTGTFFHEERKKATDGGEQTTFFIEREVKKLLIRAIVCSLGKLLALGQFCWVFVVTFCPFLEL